MIELSKLLMYETYYDKIQHYLGAKSIQLHYIDTHSLGLCVNTKNIINDRKNPENLFDFGSLNENLELFKNKNKNVNGKTQIETARKIRLINLFV